MDIHRCRFVDYNPSSINALAFSHTIPRNPRSSRIPSSLRLAVGRANGTIEIWNPLANWLHESTLQSSPSSPGDKKINSIEGLAWIQSEDPNVKGGEVSRLFSIGGSTKVTEWDLTTGRPLTHFDCNKGIIWSIAAQPKKSHFTPPSGSGATPGAATTDNNNSNSNEDEEGEGGEQLVVGCSDGSLVLVSAEGGRGSMQFVRVVSHSKKARVLSLAYQTPYTVIAGMSDSRMRVFDIRAGSNRVISSMSVGQDRQKDVLLWSVKWLPGPPGSGGYLVAGDSRGEVTLWDGKRYTMLQRIKAHEADVLAIEVNGNGGRIVTTGIDRKAIVFDVVGKNNARKLVQVSGRRFHKNDVRAMACFESGSMSVAVSGGIDGSPIIIPIYSWGKEFHRTLPHTPQTPIISTVQNSRLLVAQFEREIKIWHIEDMNKITNIDSEDFDFFGEDRTRTLVGKIVPDLQENIVASAISANGQLLALSTLSCIKVFYLRRSKNQRHILRVSKVHVDDDITNLGARVLSFSPDGHWLCCIDAKSQVHQIQITRDEEATSASSFTLGDVQKLKRKDKEITLGSDRKLAPRDGVVGLGKGYERQIYRIIFSPDGSALAATDLGGWIDCWRINEEGKWSLTKAHFPRLRSPAIAIGFRPALNFTASNSPARLAVENDISEYETLPSPAADKHTSLQLLHQQHEQMVLEKQKRLQPQPSTRLFVVSSYHDIFEFEVVGGGLTDWSKRNTPEKLPDRFKQIIDRCCGMTFTNDLKKETQRLWLWGPSWVQMFDICRDMEAKPVPKGGQQQQQQAGQSRVKRKRDGTIERANEVGVEKTAGAGRRMPSDVSGGALAFRNESVKEYIGFKEVTKKKTHKGNANDGEDVNSDEENFLVDPMTKRKDSTTTRHEQLLLNGKDDVDSSSDSDSDSSSSSSSSSSDSDSSSGSSSGSSDDSSSSDNDSDSDSSSSRSSSSDDDDESDASDKEDEKPSISKKDKGKKISAIVDPMDVDPAPTSGETNTQTAITTTTGNDIPISSTPRKGGLTSWSTHKYRSLMAFAPIGNLHPTAGERLEIVVVERPQWDIQLPTSKFEEKRDVVK